VTLGRGRLFGPDAAARRAVPWLMTDDCFVTFRVGRCSLYDLYLGLLKVWNTGRSGLVGVAVIYNIETIEHFLHVG
jgi:hypothetical protein